MRKPFPFALCAVIFLAFSGPFIARGQSVEFFMSNGQELLQHGAYNQAVNAFRQALAREPDYFEAQYNLGLTYLQWGDNPQAVAELKKALRLQPKNSIVWSSLAVAYDNQNKNADAMNALIQAVTYDPGNTTARMNLAAMYANAKQMPQAIAQYRELVKMDGGNVEAMLNLSRCLVFTNQLADAKEFLKKAIAAQPDKGEAHGELGDIYFNKEHDTGKAIVEYQAAIMVEQNNPAYYQQLAWALQNTGRTQEAIEAWKKAQVYLDDPLQKEEVQHRIDQLEQGGKTTGDSIGSRPRESTMTRRQTEDLEREVRPDTSKGVRRLESKPVDITGDIDQLNADTTSLDLTKELNKYSGQKNSTQGK